MVLIYFYTHVLFAFTLHRGMTFAGGATETVSADEVALMFLTGITDGISQTDSQTASHAHKPRKSIRLGQIYNNVPGKSPAGIFEEKQENHFF